MTTNWLRFWKQDIPASIVVFLVAIPLCLGIAIASGAPPISGMIAGMVGGIIVASISQSSLSVSGPAAGLIAIVLDGITQCGSFNAFLLAVVIAGCLQVLMGALRAGVIAYYFPGNVIKGLLAAIGITIILKQVPHAFGYDKDAEGDFSFLQTDGKNTFSEILDSLQHIHLGAIAIALLSFAILIIWPKIKVLRLMPAPLVAVLASIAANHFFSIHGNDLWHIANSAKENIDRLVELPVISNLSEATALFTLPNFSTITNASVWWVACVIALVASIETLLNVEATDNLDPLKRTTPPNKELVAQGIGNICSGLLGGLPVTSVIVRSSANINAGAASKLSAITHGLLIALCTFFIPSLLNLIPKAALAAVLILTGYKLCKWSVFKEMFKKGFFQWLPFIATVVAIIFKDLLFGISIGLAISIIFLLISNARIPYFFRREKSANGDSLLLELAQEVSFLNKASIRLTLNNIPARTSVTIDASKAMYIDYDVLEIIKEFEKIQAPTKQIKVVLTGFKEEYKILNTHQANEILDNNSSKKHTELMNQLEIGT
jgi:MFS superfamily sulfate permease-like transporter